MFELAIAQRWQDSRGGGSSVAQGQMAFSFGSTDPSKFGGVVDVSRVTTGPKIFFVFAGIPGSQRQAWCSVGFLDRITLACSKAGMRSCRPSQPSAKSASTAPPNGDSLIHYATLYDSFPIHAAESPRYA